jgi:hypothetical protein
LKDQDSILQCLKSLTPKNLEEYDGIPQITLIDGWDQLVAPLTSLFDMIHTDKKIPEQWKVAKTVPIFKNI